MTALFAPVFPIGSTVLGCRVVCTLSRGRRGLRCDACQGVIVVTVRGIHSREARAAKTPRCLTCRPHRPGGMQPFPAGRHAEPGTPNARECVKLMREGMTYIQAAKRVGMANSSAEKLMLRWLVYPEWLAMKGVNK